MDKLVFKSQKIRTSGKRSTVVRLNHSEYYDVEEISEKTGLPLSTVLSRLVRFALDHTELEG